MYFGMYLGLYNRVILKFYFKKKFKTKNIYYVRGLKTLKQCDLMGFIY